MNPVSEPVDEIATGIDISDNKLSEDAFTCDDANKMMNGVLLLGSQRFCCRRCGMAI